MAKKTAADTQLATTTDKPPVVSSVTASKGRGRRRTPVILSLLVIVLLVAGGTYYWFNREPDCATLTKEATELIKKKDYKEAYAKLQPHAEECGSTKSKLVTDNDSRLEYDYQLSVSAYHSGHKDEAKKYSASGLDVLKEIRMNEIEDTGKIKQDKDQDNTAFDLISIQQGQFYNYRGKK